ncbi:hypothetical protein HDV57DRAFT_167354 [Trichoderma longibrachiatum]|uniref:Uncharacterized protein n=1 Tax=Trichoderma longibrachiatum ATCC 18648 TaxID=983965 RepID=A0A2T4C9Y6_TRILO|nr:hypothetical protein M440DRAFT_259913 [Trichoderma longibrachiatum ATCC 18648]
MHVCSWTGQPRTDECCRTNMNMDITSPVVSSRLHVRPESQNLQASSRILASPPSLFFSFPLNIIHACSAAPYQLNRQNKQHHGSLPAPPSPAADVALPPTQAPEAIESEMSAPTTCVIAAAFSPSCASQEASAAGTDSFFDAWTASRLHFFVISSFHPTSLPSVLRICAQYWLPRMAH